LVGKEKQSTLMPSSYVSGRLAILTGILLLSVILSGCVYQKFVTEPYPRWGKEVRVDPSESDGPLILRVLSPENSNQAPACVLLVHGMNEHIGRYDEVARYFARKFLVAGFDHYAHGLSNPVLQQADSALVSGSGRQHPARRLPRFRCPIPPQSVPQVRPDYRRG